MSRVLLQTQSITPTAVADRIGLYAKADVTEDKLVYQTDDGVEHVIMKNPMTAAGDIIIGGTSGATTKLTVGSEDQVLKVTSGVPAWVTLGGILWLSATSATNAVNRSGYLLNSTRASFTVTLPASPTVGNEIDFLDAAGICTTKPVTIARNGNLIQGLAENLIIDFNSAALSLVYSSTGWRVNNFIKGVKGEQGNPGFGGMWELVERWEPTEAATSHTFSGLNGNVDRRYRIVGTCTNVLYGFSSIIATINNDNTVSNYKNRRNYGAGSIDDNKYGGLFFGLMYGTQYSPATTFFSIMELTAKTGLIRLSNTVNERYGWDSKCEHIGGGWNNTADNITSITINSDLSNVIAVGSCIELWKLAQ